MPTTGRQGLTAETSVSQICKEIELLIKVDHVNVVKIYEYYMYTTDIFIVMEYLDGGELFYRIAQGVDQLSIEFTRGIMTQLLSALSYMHHYNIGSRLTPVHCDLKPENILIESKKSSRIKIIDLGLSQIRSKKRNLKTERGSIYYLAPEMIRKDYDHKVDVWSAGVIFYILITGNPPFNAMVKGTNGNMGIDSAKIKEKILKGKVDFKCKIFNKCDPEIREIIRLMLTYDPVKRPDAKDILQLPWFRRESVSRRPGKGGTSNDSAGRGLLEPAQLQQELFSQARRGDVLRQLLRFEAGARALLQALRVDRPRRRRAAVVRGAGGRVQLQGSGAG